MCRINRFSEQKKNRNKTKKTSRASTRCVGSKGFRYKRKMEIKLKKTRRVSTTCVGSTGFQNRRYFFVENQHLLCRKELFEGGCTDENYYGYPEAKPCIMVSPKNFWQNFFRVHTITSSVFLQIKLNKIFAWKPTPYQNETQVHHWLPYFYFRNF